MRLSRVLFGIFGALYLVVNQSAAADTTGAKRPIVVIGRQSATITTAEIRLGDLADVSGRSIDDDEAVIALKKIQIDSAPSAGASVTISAAQILERLERSGIKLSEIAYTLPRLVTVTRAGREVSEAEIRTALEENFKATNREAEIKLINLRDKIQIPTGDVTFRASELGSNSLGKRSFAIEVLVEGKAVNKFTVEASLDEWASVPVASRSITRGTVIGEDDVMMARMNLSALPRDTTDKLEDIVGQEAKSTIPSGDVFRAQRLNLPPVISAGSRVTLRYRSGPLLITTSGTALEAGTVGQQIKVKNEDSRKIVAGTVLEAGLVGINP